MRLPPVLTRNWPLKLTSLFLAVVLWLLAAGEEPSSRLVTAELRVRPPDGRDVVRAPGPVAVSVVGPARELLKLSATRLLITRILPDTLTGTEVVLTLSPGDVELPADVRAAVQDLEPRRVTIQLDEVAARELPVAVRFTPGAAVAGAIAVDPPTVRLVGPAAALAGLDSVRTLPLAADDLRGPFGQSVGLDTAGLGAARPVPRRVTVTVGDDPVVERVLAAVPVHLEAALAERFHGEPGRVAVRLSGPAARVAALEPGGVVVLAEGAAPDTGAALPLRLVVPAGLEASAEPAAIRLVPRRP